MPDPNVTLGESGPEAGSYHCALTGKGSVYPTVTQVNVPTTVNALSGKSECVLKAA